VRSSGRRLALGAVLLAVCACGQGRAPSRSVYTPSRFDYYAFRGAFDGLVEPNYLPFMAHPIVLDGDRFALVFCRWDRERFPLAVHVSLPAIPDELQDEFDPIAPGAYRAAVESALDAWERNLEGLVRFRLVERESQADLSIQLLAEPAPRPEPFVEVLGRISMDRACRLGDESESDRFEASFEAHSLRIYLADAHGLLNPDQVGTVALHELGHALGMRGHSPIRADVMYRVARDNPLVRGPSDLDVNSFVSLYGLPNGTVYLRTSSHEEPERRTRPPSGPPLLAAAPHVDARFGYQLRLALGWQRLETERGMIAADGLAWDYAATFQVIVRGYATVQEYLDRHEAAHLGAGRVVEDAVLRVAGRPARRLLVAGRAGPMMEELTFIQVGDGRVVVVIADCALRSYAAYRPWFAAVLDSLEIRSLTGRSGAPRAGTP
jgi:predicted Zn-dependent protease